MSKKTCLWSIWDSNNPPKQPIRSLAINMLWWMDFIINIVLYPIYFIIGKICQYVIGGELYDLANKGLMRYILDLNINNPNKKIVYFRLANLKMGLVKDLYLTKNLCKFGMDKIKRGKVYERLTIFFGNGAFTTYDTKLWKIHREEFYKMVTSEKLHKYAPIYYYSLANAIKKEINKSSIVDLYTFLPHVNLIAFCQTYFKIDVSPYADKIILPMNRLLKYINNAMDPVFIRFGTQYTNFKRDIDTVHKFLENLMHDAIEKNTGDEDLLKAFTSGIMTKEQLVQFMISIVLGGHEGTSRTIMGIICSMLNNDKIVHKLREELDDYFSVSSLSHNIIKLPYLQNIVNEGLRLYPPVWICSREVLEDITVDDIVIKKNTQLMLSPLLIHRDPNIWGKDAEEFIPERYETMKKYKNNIFFPFLLGPENCTGEKLAILEISLFVVEIFKNYNVKIITNIINPHSAGTFRITDSYLVKLEQIEEI